MNRKTVVIAAGLTLALLTTTAYSGWWPFKRDTEETVVIMDARELGWEDLIPDDFVQPENPYATMSQEEIDKLMDGSEESNAKLQALEAEFNYAPVVSELDGTRVKIPAYITPLEFNGDTHIKEFLLVPYVGACIHTPPPPANQVVFAETPEALEFPGMYVPVWATGIIRAETVQSDLAETGYRIEIESMEPYTLEE